VDEMRARGEQPERFHQFAEVAERNARKIEERPEIVFDNLTRRQSTFTRRDIAREVFRYIDDGERFGNLMARLEGSSELITLVARSRVKAVSARNGTSEWNDDLCGRFSSLPLSLARRTDDLGGFERLDS
jgi:hypothetical protein